MTPAQAPSTPSVLHLLAPAPVGGLEAVVERIAGGQAARGTGVQVGPIVEPAARPHPLTARLEGAGVPVAPLVVPHRAYATEVRAVASLLDRLDPDVVHTHGYRADVVAGTVARRRGRATVSTVHGFTGGGGKNRLYEWLQRRSLARFDAVVAVSRPLGRDLRDGGVPPERLHVVPNAWRPTAEPLDRGEARRRLDLPGDAFVVGWVGRLSREKGADVLLRALARLGDGGDAGPPAGGPGGGSDGGAGSPEDRAAGVVASVVGEGPQEAALRELAAELGLSGRVRFHGTIPGAAELYRAFDVFALSSRTEGTPVSLFEAMEAGVPVVAARVGGVPDVVTERHARLVPPEDPGALALALQEVRRDPEGAGERARRARRRLREDFAVEPWLDRYEAVYRAAVAGGEGAA